MAMLTNNVREWEPLWRTMLPVDEIFETVVDSAFVGYRKPEPQIYEITLERLGLSAEALPLRRRHRGQLRGGAGARHAPPSTSSDNEQAIAGDPRRARAQPAAPWPPTPRTSASAD